MTPPAAAAGLAPAPPSGAGSPPVRVLLCDDSATVRAALAGLLAGEPDIRIVGHAANGRQALAEIGALVPSERPDLVLLDLEMPVMDGMTVLPLLLGLAPPRPAVIVASALTQRGAAAAMAALRAGAVDYVPKPSAASGGLRDPGFRAELLAKLRGWARVGRGNGMAERQAPVLKVARPRGAAGVPAAVAVGCSTGGPQALSLLVRRLGQGGALPVPMLVVQHMPAGFTAMLADHLGRIGGPPCAEAVNGEALLPGRIYLAPGNRHLLAEGGSGRLVARLSGGPPENFCRPAVDPLLRSLAACCGGRLVAAILTGMGQDGLAGCRAVAAAGGFVLAQDEGSSVVWGMPGAVAKAGLAQALLPPAAIADQIHEALRGAAAPGQKARMA